MGIKKVDKVPDLLFCNQWPCLLLCLLYLFLGGCQVYKKEVPTGSPMQIDNVYANPSYDHGFIKKVVLLPILNPNERKGVVQYREEITLSVMRNFGKFNYFNIQYDKNYEAVSAGEAVNVDTGAYHRLKLGELGREYHAQGILQVTVSEFKPFFPLVMKVKSTLVDANSGEIVWVFDHVFDASDAEVINGMRIWWNTRKAGGDPSMHFISAKNRPGAFIDYICYMMARSYGDMRVVNLKAIERQEKEEQRKEREVVKMQKKNRAKQVFGKEY